MSGPIVFVSNVRIKDRRLDDYKEAFPQVADEIKKDKPGTVAFLAYANEGGTEGTIVHIFPDGESMALHIQGSGERSKRAAGFLEVVSWEIYGDPGEEVMETMKKIAASGITLNVKPHSVGGYIRFKPG
jgi:hypothetical protein